MLDRRQTMQLIGAAAATTVLPAAAIAEATPVAKATPELLILRDQVQKMVDDFDLAGALDAAGAQYSQIYRYHRARIDTCPDCDARLEDGITELSHAHGGGGSSQRFIRFIAHHPVDLGFAILQREGHSHPDTDVPPMLARLVASFIAKRELDAVAIFENGRTYDPTVGADGVAMFSDNHPYDQGVWSNILPMEGPPDARLILESAIHVAGKFVTDEGNPARSRAKRIIIPVALMPWAERALQTTLRPGSADSDVAALGTMPPGLQPYLTWDYLRNNQNWFCQTNVDGLIWSERDPLTLRVEIDPKINGVLVLGHEKRGFGCTDPRAVLGVFNQSPSA